VTGVSSDNETSVVATQLRAFGEVGPQIRYYAEAAWAASSDAESGAFGAAYPYGNRAQIIEAYAERVFQPPGTLVDVRAGRYRPPFGMHEDGQPVRYGPEAVDIGVTYSVRMRPR
jgi:hypothetical protein